MTHVSTSSGSCMSGMWPSAPSMAGHEHLTCMLTIARYVLRLVSPSGGLVLAISRDYKFTMHPSTAVDDFDSVAAITALPLLQSTHFEMHVWQRQAHCRVMTVAGIRGVHKSAVWSAQSRYRKVKQQWSESVRGLICSLDMMTWQIATLAQKSRQGLEGSRRCRAMARLLAPSVHAIARHNSMHRWLLAA
jgi:hypothetical protein